MGVVPEEMFDRQQFKFQSCVEEVISLISDSSVHNFISQCMSSPAVTHSMNGDLMVNSSLVGKQCVPLLYINILVNSEICILFINILVATVPH